MAGRIEIYDVETRQGLGEIGEAELQSLIDLFEEEHGEDHDYWIDAPTLEMLAETGADPNLIRRLRDALGLREGFDLGWRRIA